MPIYANGIFYNKPNEKAPDFVIGNISILKDRFADWLMTQESNEKGYVKLVIKNGREGKPYIELDTWKPTQKFMTERQNDNMEESF